MFPEVAVRSALSACLHRVRADAYQEGWVAFLSGGDPTTTICSYCGGERRHRQREVLAVDLRLRIEDLAA